MECIGSRLIFVILLVCSVDAHKTLECDPTDDICEFTMDVGFKQTMVDGDNKLVYLHDGMLYRYDVNASDPSALPTSTHGIITADGYAVPRMIITINGQMPGPTLNVYEGQTLKIHVTNNLYSDAIAIHWHGIHQIGTPWMDGAAYVTQCPINPGQSFTYEFSVPSAGTFFYHNHIGMLQMLGLHGALIVRERTQNSSEEHVVLITEYNHEWEADLQLQKNMFGDYKPLEAPFGVPAIDGTSFTKMKWHAGLINGRGRYFNENGQHTGAPLTSFKVAAGEKYRFRIIGGGSAFPFRFSIDGHSLKIVASDGFDIEPIIAESIILHNGERYDIEMIADQSVGNYWIRAKTLEAGVDHSAYAILQYNESDTSDPLTSNRACTSSDRCVVVNCPFSVYPGEPNVDCVTFNDIKFPSSMPAFGANQQNIEEMFFNFGFPGGSGYRYGSVNGRSMMLSPISALTQPRELSTSCDNHDCGTDKICVCTYAVSIGDQKAYQLVFTNYGNGASGPHPIHSHGHAFQVLKVGYHQYDQITGKYSDGNGDISCDGSYCNGPYWNNTSWNVNTIPGLETQKPPMKDTIMVPKGGYAIVRITASNPGLWMLHCHMDPHTMRGMAMLLNESFSEVPPAPSGFPQCRNFPAPEFTKPNDIPCSTPTPQPSTGKSAKQEESPVMLDEDTIPIATFWGMFGALLAVAAIELFIIIGMCAYYRRTATKTLS
ncbi:ASO-like protein [Mya arenaria]|uniref:ASO-like protein n=1 Tax=Mya arenaria TaxID=6604 RepID=A0ABY7FXX1_MYAAR|nr:uncharacterized protein LOC128216869 [Mya arenaria]WAR25666.1 ASO-like protein [Mya arenaria]